MPGSRWRGPITWGAPAAALGGALGLLAGEVVIGLLRGGLLGRALSWAVLGLGIGLGQGLADRSRERLVYGLIGGGLGGFAGGFLFEWLRSTFSDRTDLSQAVGIVLLGGRAGPVPGTGRTGAATSMGSGSERPAGRAASICWPIRAAGWDSTSAPRSAFSATRPSPAACRDRVNAARICPASPGGAGQSRASTAARWPPSGSCRMETGSSWGIPCWCSGTDNGDRCRASDS